VKPASDTALRVIFAKARITPIRSEFVTSLWKSRSRRVRQGFSRITFANGYGRREARYCPSA